MTDKHILIAIAAAFVIFVSVMFIRGYRRYEYNAGYEAGYEAGVNEMIRFFNEHWEE